VTLPTPPFYDNFTGTLESDGPVAALANYLQRDTLIPSAPVAPCVCSTLPVCRTRAYEGLGRFPQRGRVYNPWEFVHRGQTQTINRE
jgi:hypothetical protein